MSTEISGVALARKAEVLKSQITVGCGDVVDRILSDLPSGVVDDPYPPFSTAELLDDYGQEDEMSFAQMAGLLAHLRRLGFVVSRRELDEFGMPITRWGCHRGIQPLGGGPWRTGDPITWVAGWTDEEIHRAEREAESEALGFGGDEYGP